MVRRSTSSRPILEPMSLSQPYETILLEDVPRDPISNPKNSSSTSLVKAVENDVIRRTRRVPLVAAFLRSIKMLSLLIIGGNIIGSSGYKEEVPKVAIRRGIVSALLSLSVHIIPLAATITIVALNMRTKLVVPPISTTTFQFLAKGCELLAQASISMPIFMYLRHELTQSDGLPFGALFSGLEFRNISYLWSLEFFGSLTSTSFSARRKTIFLLFSAFNVLLTLAIGPSIAICLIPRSDPFTIIKQKVWFDVAADSTTLFPSTIGVAMVRPECFSLADTQRNNFTCPATGWEYLKRFANQLDMFVSREDSHSLEIKAVLFDEYPALTTFDIANLRSESLKGWISGRNASSFAYSATSLQMILLTRTLTRAWALWLPELQGPLQIEVDELTMEVQGQQPLTFVECSPYQDKVSGPNGSSSLPSSNLSTSSSWQIEWVDVDTDNTGISIGAFVLSPFQKVDTIQWCSIIAGWAESTSFANPKKNDQAVIFRSKDVSWSGHPVKVSSDWAKYLTPTFADTNISVFDSLMRLYDFQSDQAWLATLEGAVIPTIGSLVANGMMNIGYDSRVDWTTLLQHKHPASDFYRGHSLPLFPLDRSLFDVPESSTEGKFAATYRYWVKGLVYSARSIPVKLSLAVLMIYILYIFIFIIYVLGFSRVSSYAWDSNAEWTALALLSKPTEKVKNASAGIETMTLFKEPVNIGTAGRDHVEIIFKNDAEQRVVDTVELNKEY